MVLVDPVLGIDAHRLQHINITRNVDFQIHMSNHFVVKLAFFCPNSLKPFPGRGKLLLAILARKQELL